MSGQNCDHEVSRTNAALAAASTAVATSTGARDAGTADASVVDGKPEAHCCSVDLKFRVLLPERSRGAGMVAQLADTERCGEPGVG
eukprot:12974-Heterococcus_DN1.PRE.2